MVVTEQHGEVLLFEQHEHARVCGELARAWRGDYFIGKEFRDSVIFAIDQHDNGWIELDQCPKIDEDTGLPYSFMNYPLKTKLGAYRKCIDRIAKYDDYAALICSLHYASFFEDYTDGRGEDFLLQERKRQTKLRKHLTINNASLKFHYDILQFCDNLSLYLCLNEPGVSKENEFQWFREGFLQRFQFNDKKKMTAHWLNHKTVALSDFPFKQEVTISLSYKSILRSNLCLLEEQYQTLLPKQRVVTIVKK